MKKTLRLLLLLASITSFAGEIKRKPTEAALPESLKVKLNKQFPAYRLANKDDYCPTLLDELPLVGKGTWAYGALETDFNKDGLKDYSLIISTKGEMHWVGAIAQSSGTFTVKDFGPPVISTDNIPKNKLEGKICDGIFMVTERDHSGNERTVVGLEAAGQATEWYVENGKWKQTGFDS